MTAHDTRPLRESEPEPDDIRKPDSPRDLTASTWNRVFRRSVRKFGADQGTDVAATLTYYAVLSVFPAFIAVVSLLGVFGQGTRSTDAILSILRSVAPAPVVDVLRGPLDQISTSPAAGLALGSGLVLAIWSASGYVGAFGRAMNRIYGVPEGRPFLRLKPMELLVTLAVILLVLIMVATMVFSGRVTDALGNALGLSEPVRVAWAVLKWPALAAALVIAIAILYYATPNVRQPRFRWLSPGAVLAVIILVLASLGFGFYVANFGNYANTYGSLTGIVVFLLWLWIANLALVFGAEFDAELERARELRAGIDAEEAIRLPPRNLSRLKHPEPVHSEPVRDEPGPARPQGRRQDGVSAARVGRQETALATGFVALMTKTLRRRRDRSES